MYHSQASFLPIGRDTTKRPLARLRMACALTAASLMIAAAPARGARDGRFKSRRRNHRPSAATRGRVSGSTRRSLERHLASSIQMIRKTRSIVDLQLAPRNARGKVEYSFDFYILKPIDLSKGNHKMLYEPPNRGGKTISAFNRGVGGNDPGSVTDAIASREFIPDAAGLFDIVQRLGPLGGNEYGQFQYDHHAADRQELRWVVDHRSVL